MKTQSTKKSISDVIDDQLLRIGRVLSWANGLLVVVIVTQVVLRYGFGHGLVVLEEFEWHLYGLAFMFGLSYALVTDAHVRVDLLQSKFSEKTRCWIEVVGTLLVLLPFIVAVVIHGYDFFLDSWTHSERSSAPLGLPFRWAIKAVIPVSFVLFGVAALSRVLRCLSVIFGNTNATD